MHDGAGKDGSVDQGPAGKAQGPLPPVMSPWISICSEVDT
jgi:hypothetical protein